MSQRNYTNFAKNAAPASSIAGGDTSIDVDTQTDYPDAPYVIVVFEGADTPPAASTKEVMRVTGVSGSGPYTLTVERDIDGYNAGGVSFTTSATVQHVSVADEVGPTESVTKSQIAQPSSRLTAYDGFIRGSLGEAPSGQSWTVQSGGASLNRGLTQSGSGLDATLAEPRTSSDAFSVGLSCMLDNGGGNQISLYIGYQNADNWVRVRARGGGRVYLEKSVAGSISTIATTDNGPNRYRGMFGEYRFSNHPPTGSYVFGFVPWGTDGFNNGDGDVDTILDNSVGIGVSMSNGYNGFAEGLWLYDKI